MRQTYIFLIAILSILIGFGCGSDSLVESSGDSNGTLSGSYANLLTIDNNLYMVTESQLITFDITDPKIPKEVNRLQLDFGIESLYYRMGLLFVGSQTTMYIYELDGDGIPVLLSETEYGNFEDFTACDPIVAIDDFAYVTLSSDINVQGACGGSRLVEINELRVYDISDLQRPNLINIIEMEEPKGLAVDDNWLFVCEKNNGLKVFDLTVVDAPVQIHHFPGFKAFDVIPVNGLLLVVGPDDLYQYDYTDMPNMSRLSRITL